MSFKKDTRFSDVNRFLYSVLGEVQQQLKERDEGAKEIQQINNVRSCSIRAPCPKSIQNSCCSSALFGRTTLMMLHSRWSEWKTTLQRSSLHNIIYAKGIRYVTNQIFAQEASAKPLDTNVNQTIISKPSFLKRVGINVNQTIV